MSDHGAVHHRWIVVADSPFLPVRGGGDREQLGFIRAAAGCGLVGALVMPAEDGLDVSGYQQLVGDALVVVASRNRSPLRMLRLRTPFVVASRPAPVDLARRLAGAVSDATAVIVLSYKSHAIGRLVAQGLGLPAILRQHNLEGPYHHALAAGARWPGRPLLTWEARKVDADERRLEHEPWLLAIADISASDAAVRAARAGVPVLHVPPFAIDPDHITVQRRPEPGTVLFVGSLDVATNHDALAWFLDGAWPRIRASAPGCRLDVVGSRPPAWLMRRLVDTPGVRLRADVPDVEPFLRTAQVAVNPTVSGSGVNIKLVEYLLAELPTVTTSRPMAALGIGAGPVVADDPESFADGVTQQLLANPDNGTYDTAELARRVAHLVRPAAGIRRLTELL